MDASKLRQAVYEIHDRGRRRGHYFQVAEDDAFVGRRLRLAGRELVSFGSCSYLGLEFDPRLVEGAREAYRRFGAQTSYSRGYLSCPLYEVLERELLPQVFGAPHVLVLPSSTIAHQVVMPALLAERDAIVIDHQTHRSVDDAVTLQCARSHATKVVVRHGELDRVRETIAQLARRHDTVWLATDGVYSMYGDYLPASFYAEVLAIAPNVRLYVDDAHGMSWAGTHGCGHFLSRFAADERVVVVTSLAKAFAVGGGVVVLRDAEIAETARLVGGPFSFSGPMRPGDLGAAVASARVHLGPDLRALQRRLFDRVQQLNQRCRELGVPVAVENETPIVFIPVGRADAVFDLAEATRDDGFHINVSGFPAVPSGKGGLRIAVSALHTEAEIDALAHSLAAHLPRVLAAHGLDVHGIVETFRDALPRLAAPSQPSPRLTLVAPPSRPLHVATVTDARELRDHASWDAAVAGLGCIDAATLRAVATVHHPHHAQPQWRWRVRALELHDAQQRLIAAAPLTTCLVKDDIFMHANVSHALEAEREQHPYRFTSLVVSLGTMVSEGPHLALPQGPRPGIAEAIVATMRELAASDGAKTLVLRDLAVDHPLAAALPGLDFVPMPIPKSHVLELDRWHGPAEFTTSRAGTRRRRHVEEVQQHADAFTTELWDQHTDVSDELLTQLHASYLGLAARNRDINVFPLTVALLRALLSCGAWSFLVLRYRGVVVSWAALHRAGTDLRPLVCGVDYRPFGDGRISPYRQLLWQIIAFAGEHGFRRVHLGMGADYEKDRFGTRTIDNVAWVRAPDDFQAVELAEFVTRLATQRSEVRA
ncbi:MAG: GNAT family N-acetyltransferase [Nannocystaceae bacterium]|nr:GNAT family N-acetyltransferase [Nannocystaceae bacterium]